jgi:hypothetical protein
MGKHTLVEPGTVPREEDYAARYYRAHGSAHYYPKRQLADRSISTVKPWCQVGKLVPELHEHTQIDPMPPTENSPFQICHNCRAELAAARAGRIS